MKFESSKFEEKEHTPLEQWTQLGIKEALTIIKKRFENKEDKVENLAFHNTRHTQEIIKRVEKILLAMKEEDTPITEKDMAIGKLSAAFHDVVQEWEEDIIQDDNFEKVMRQRFIGDNEKVSANTALEFMKKVNREAKEKIFEEEDMATTKEAIEATVPDFDPEKNTVIQPNLHKKSSLIAKALALADIGAAGMGGYKEFAREGNDLFWEENIDILKALENPKKLTAEQKEYFRERMLAWSKFQSLFAAGRKALLSKELSGLSSSVQEKVKDLFNKFDESIAGAQTIIVWRKKMSFKELIKDMGYNF